VRAHIADPATFFHPLHQASLLAFRRFQTVYFPEKSYKMFNENMLKTWPLSLGHQPREGEPQPVLTFSGRIDEDGNTVATHVEGGWIGPPHILTYDQVNTAFGTPAPRPRYWIRNFDLDPIATADTPPVPVTPEMQADLQTLRMLTDKLQRKRDTLRWEMPSASISVSATGPSTPPRVALGLPGLAANNAVADSILDTGVAQTMVAEVAIMANRIAAQFTFERDIMVPYLVQPPPSGDRATLERLMAKRDELGMVSYRDVLPNIHKMAIAPSSHSMAPGPHYGLGISDEHGYVRATSPLRRYSDLYIHWQIKEALKSRRWRFNKRVDAATAELVTEIGRDVHKTNLGRRAEHHWLFYGLQQEYNKVRAGQASLESEELFGSLKGIVLQSMAVEQHGVNAGLLFIPALGCRAHFRMPSFTALWQPGQDVKVAIQSFILSDIPRLNVEVTGPA
jgi:exoribonuclease R